MLIQIFFPNLNHEGASHEVVYRDLFNPEPPPLKRYTR